MTPQDLYSFLSDARLVDLVERVKISDDFLDVVSLSETQHSDMLAWCLHPNEGHGQGDAVVKDFLTAAYNAGAGANKFSNKIFFEKWTPGRIRTASFGSSFIAREFSLSTGDAGKKNRLDLFLIDPSNRIVVVIENKAGASLTEEQLSSYYATVSNQIGNRPVFKEYDFAYVVVDRDLTEYDEEHLKSLGNKWALLDYGWLEASANRARRHLERNNEAAQLLMAYCQKQTGWQSPNEKHVSELSAELASQHEVVVEAIRQIRKVRPTEWTPTSFSGEFGELLLFFHQNRQLCDHLIQARGIGSVLVGLRKALRTLSHEEIEHGRTWLSFSTPGMQSLMRVSDGYWPIYVNVYRETKSDDENSKFTVRLIWITDEFLENGCDVEALRQHMAISFRGLDKFGNSAVRRLVIDSKLSVTAAVKKAAEVSAEIESRISSARRNGILH
ncbi:PD-(D/E)XK nuclease family protein [Burkholderia vietnamiensis]|uniref:PDDEXK-like family protein n=1 Tax=Burkholderia vietnamiensis TaxID=60552 RepID=UPI0009C04FBC|nr:PD-(D/E)XK nuclease family protein [Burkholderia vietnamiensis]MDN7927144.1 PD-(D/E)XK nuclease family protein [Burkholderia vietnamiensis]HDR9253511.1 PD-(D/E)XK nuclease family protein [Burkholderia vietnamiensis]